MQHFFAVWWNWLCGRMASAAGCGDGSLALIAADARGHWTRSNATRVAEPDAAVDGLSTPYIHSSILMAGPIAEMAQSVTTKPCSVRSSVLLHLTVSALLTRIQGERHSNFKEGCRGARICCRQRLRMLSVNRQGLLKRLEKRTSSSAHAFRAAPVEIWPRGGINLQP